MRIDTTQAISITNLKYIYDYYLKDHLGNVRSVLTTEQQTDLYAATMETAAATKEDVLFSNVSGTATAKPADFSADNSNQMVSKLNGDVNISGNKRVGPSIVLKVMAGDTISISAYGWYSGAVQPPATGVPDISTELLPLLTNGILADGGNKGGTISGTTMNPLISAALSTFLTTGRHYISTRPKAFLNWMAMDEEFYADTMPNHMGAVQVPVCNAGDSLKQLVGPANMVIRRNGWIYIYLSNESAQDLFFDNLVVNLKHGPLIEQNDYYSYGMLIPGLSTKAYKYQYNPNRYQYNGIEHDTAFGLDEYEAHYRDLDPEIGRWTTIDPDIENGMEDQSPYSSMNNNPILKSDPLGDNPDGEDGCCDIILPSIFINPTTVHLAERANQALATTARQIEVATAGAESGFTNTMTFGATPNVPFMPSSYTDAEMSQFNTAFFIGQVSTPFFEIPSVTPKPKLSLMGDGPHLRLI